ncbi:MAG: hypothetical protein C0475_01420 [Planctomyces sp.]|nr:hypothetical protein [Planctomyces sp.]MBA4039020.1 hypothetical protein [Planctomyces sp.]MBA4119243.1 hypothetical protein [Isosphaera sp.]
MPQGHPDPRRQRPGQPQRPEEGEPRDKRPTPPPGVPGQPGAWPGRSIFALLAVVVLIVVLIALATGGLDRAKRLSTWQEFESLYANRRLVERSVQVRDNGVYAERKPGQISREEGEVYFQFSVSDKEFYLKKVDELTNGQYSNAPTGVGTQILQVLLSILPFLLGLVILLWLLSRGLRSASGGPGGMLGNFGKSRHRVLMKEKTGVTFDDVAGIEEAKYEVEEVIQFLKNPKRFMRLGGRIPRGVLLVGEPGCGKTLLAKAIAGEADVPFFTISGSDFVEMFVGVGASRVRDLFKQAKDSAPCIVFLDEIDAVGRRRGGGFSSGGHDEREQTLNAILVEMDGFTPSDGVIVIAATNRSDVLDPALVRPGRFDRQIVVPLPDVKGRMEILKVHAKKVKLGPDADLERMAKITPMFSGADLAAIINEAAIAATLHNKDFVEQEDLEEARDKVKFGRASKSRVREADENRLIAFHEAGHAVVQVMLKDADPLHKVTVIPRGDTGGATFSLPERDRLTESRRRLLATMRVMCGGRIAEERAMGDVSSGAAMDIAQVTSMARVMVEQWGMSDRLGFIRYAGADRRDLFIPDRAYSDQTAVLIDAEVRGMVDSAFADAKRILDENWEKVEAVATALIKHETLDAADVHRLMRGEALGRPTVSELLAAEARRAREAAPAAPPAQPKADGSPDLPPGAMPTPA